MEEVHISISAFSWLIQTTNFLQIITAYQNSGRRHVYVGVKWWSFFGLIAIPPLVISHSKPQCCSVLLLKSQIHSTYFQGQKTDNKRQTGTGTDSL